MITKIRKIRKKRPQNTAIIDALAKTGGNIMQTAIALDVTRQALSKWVNSDSELKSAREEAEESINDLAESQLVRAIKNGDLTAIIFRLKTKAKNRGYVERQEHIFDKNDIINVNYTNDD